jgi:hypothetical protein
VSEQNCSTQAQFSRPAFEVLGRVSKHLYSQSPIVVDVLLRWGSGSRCIYRIGAPASRAAREIHNVSTRGCRFYFIRSQKQDPRRIGLNGILRGEVGAPPATRTGVAQAKARRLVAKRAVTGQDLALRPSLRDRQRVVDGETGKDRGSLLPPHLRRCLIRRDGRREPGGLAVIGCGKGYIEQAQIRMVARQAYQLFAKATGAESGAWNTMCNRSSTPARRYTALRGVARSARHSSTPRAGSCARSASHRARIPKPRGRMGVRIRLLDRVE